MIKNLKFNSYCAFRYKTAVCARIIIQRTLSLQEQTHIFPYGAGNCYNQGPVGHYIIQPVVQMTEIIPVPSQSI